MSKGLKEEVKIVVNSLLIPHSRGLTLDQFLKEYHDVEAKPFPHRQLGFNTPADFLRSVPKVVKCTTLRSGHILLQAVANENVSHIQELVKGQKSNQTASLKNLNRLLQQNNRYYPPFVRQCPPPPIQISQNTIGSEFSACARPPPFSVPNQMTSRPQASQHVGQTFSSTEAIIPSSHTCSNVEYERQLVSEFEKLLLAYPNGVNTAHIFALYSSRYKKEVDLHQIQPNLSSINFFKRHEHVFRIWKCSENVMVALVGPYRVDTSQLPNANQPPLEERGSLTGAIPKGQFSKNTEHPNSQPPTHAVYSMFQSPPKAAPPMFQSPTKAVPFQFKTPLKATGFSAEDVNRTANSNAFQPKLSATDIRLRNPDAGAYQTVTTEWNSAKHSPVAHLTPSNMIPGSCHAPAVADEALPVTFGVRRPKINNVYEPDTEITKQAFPSNLASFDYFFLIVAEVYSPGEFYWFLSENRKPIEDLTDDMTLFYGATSDYFIFRGEMYIGQLVAAMYTDNLWYRARIVGCHEDMFQVFYVDYGSKNLVKIERLRHLHLRFTKLPLQAFRGRIFGIRPLPTEKKWSFESGKWFLDLIKGCKIIAAAKMIEETLAVPQYGIDTVYSLTLVDTTKENDVHVSDYLIENGFAVACEEEQRALAAATPAVECLDLTPARSPSPTGTFLSSATTSLVHQLENTCLSSRATSPPTCTDQIENLALAEQSPYTTSLSAEPERSEQCYVSQLVLKDGRILYIVEDDGALYLPKPDMLKLIPNLDRQIAALKVRVDVKVVNFQTQPHIFSDCANAGAPWIMNEEGNMVPQLILYSLQHVSLLLFICSVKDKMVSSAIESKRKEYSNKCAS
ncbi:tudor domain-containing protein 7A-like isoform X2 [Daphnia carinata]|uniref:tudor domain-containing protein 7A-like isoform X2 n=1 Tax=Daphnia carinata TaxID=120202 RepID=UPI00257AC328|nr:tudor domain-containing protein 7A-like isoform X2 [Daphnia carinata]